MNDLSILKKIEKLIHSELSERQLNGPSYNTYQLDATKTSILKLNLYFGSSPQNLKRILQLVAQLTQLQCLCIEDSAISDLTHFDLLTQIKELDLDGNHLTEISPLKNLKGLTKLCLSNNSIFDISPLQELTALQYLEIANNHIRQIASLAALTNLIELGLSLNQIRAITPLKKLRKLKELDLGGNKIKTITALSCLNNLKTLNLSANNIENLTALKKLKQLRYINLNSNKVTDISALAELTQIQELNLSHNNIIDLSPLQKLSQLKELYLYQNPNLSLSTLGELKQLTVLSLSHCHINRLSPLSLHPKLEILDLAENNIEDLSPLASLSELTSLKIPRNHITNTAPLQQLTKLVDLDLSENPIDTISFVKKLPQLKELSITSCGLNDLRPVKYATQLCFLNINNNRISDLSPLQNCPDLFNLRASQNAITDISPLANLPKINFLGLNNNHINNIAPLAGLKQLVSLDLENNQLNELPDWITKFKIVWNGKNNGFHFRDVVYLTGNPLSDPPAEIVKQGTEAVRRYFDRKKKENFSAIHEAKLILVGDGAAGKTSLQKRLADPTASLPEEDTRTRGIQICNWEFKPNYIAHIWDFGGQDVYYPVHRFFLTENAVFVLLASTRNEQHNFDYWIPTLYQFGGYSPIIIGQTCHDGNRVAWNDLGSYAGDSRFNIIRATKDLLYYELNLPSRNKGLADIKKEIVHQLGKLPHCNKDIPTSWITIRETLKKEGETKPCIDYDRFTEICNEVVPGSFTEPADYTDCASFLHNIGAILWYSQNSTLKNWIILRPEWGMQAVYRIIDDDRIQRQRGQITAEDFNRLWKDKMYLNKHLILKQMLNVFRVAFPKRHKTEEYIIPARLLSMPQEKRWKYEDGLWLEYEYPFMPRGILNQLSAELSRYIVLNADGEEEVWNNAVNLTAAESTGQVTELFYQKKIIIRTRGKDARGLAMVIMDALNTITNSYKGVTPEINVPCTCHECRQGEHRTLFKYNDLQRWSAKGREDIQCNESGEKIRIDDLLHNAGFLQPVDPGRSYGLQPLLQIRIFLASSSELKVDRKEFELFINRENKQLVDKGIFLYLDLWEDALDAISATRLQDEYNQAVLKSDIFVSLFFTKAGIFTEEEFDTAYGQFIRQGKPYVYTYFKNAPVNMGELGQEVESLLRFKNKLKGLGHFPTEYKTIDDLKAQFKRQLDRLIVRLKRTPSV